MEVMIFNQIRTLRCDGVVCALLRDNVQHYLESGSPSGRFSTIHALADARWTRATETLRPRMLGAELDAVWPCLRDLPIGSLAISIRTRAALTDAPDPPQVHGTVLHRLVQWPLPYELTNLTTLGDLLGWNVAQLCNLVREAPANAKLVIRSVAIATPVPAPQVRRFFVPTTSAKSQH